MTFMDRIDMIAWGLVFAAALGMMAGLARPPARSASQWLSGLCAAGMVGFVLINGAIPLALFTGVGTWLGAMLTARRSERLRFRIGALGWIVGLVVGIWWMVVTASI